MKMQVVIKFGVILEQYNLNILNSTKVYPLVDMPFFYAKNACFLSFLMYICVELNNYTFN